MIWIVLFIVACLALIEIACIAMLLVSIVRLAFWFVVFLCRFLNGAFRCNASSD